MGKDTHDRKDKKDKKEKKDKRDRLVVLAALEFGQETPAEVLAALPDLVEATKGEDGCRKYRVHVPAEGAGRLLFYEVWESEAAFRTHLESAHLKAFREVSGRFLKDSQISTWRRMA